MKHIGRLLQGIIFLTYSIANLIYNSSELRIISFVKSLARDYGKEIKGLPGMRSIPIQLTYSEIAELTSTSPQRVKLVFNNMKAQGMVRFSDKQFLVRI